MEIEVAERLSHVKQLIDDAAEIVASGRATYDASHILQHASDNIIVQLGHDAKLLLEAGVEPLTPDKWKTLYGMRNRVAHEYNAVDQDIVWETLVTDLPSIATQLESSFKEAAEVLN